MLTVLSPTSNIDCLKLLVENGADPSIKDTLGNNLMNMAATGWNWRYFEYLSTLKGIDKFHRNNEG
jgi:hypothetical protein